MKILHIISQHPESTGSGFYLQNIIRRAADAGNQNYLIAGISGNQAPQISVIKKENFSFYFPITTSIIISIILSLLFYLFGKFFK